MTWVGKHWGQIPGEASDPSPGICSAALCPWRVFHQRQDELVFIILVLWSINPLNREDGIERVDIARGDKLEVGGVQDKVVYKQPAHSGRAVWVEA